MEGMQNFLKKSTKKLVTGAAFLGVLAGNPAKIEAQNVKSDKKNTTEQIKELPAIHVSDPNDPRLKAYQDSLDLYKLSTKGNFDTRSGNLQAG